MRTQLGLALGVLVLGVGLAPTPAPAADKTDARIRVLIIDGQNNHDWRATTPILKKALEDSGRFAVEVATTPQEPALPPKPQSADDKDLARFKEALSRYADAYAEYRRGMATFHPNLDRYDVVLSNYNGEMWPAALREDLEGYVKSGKGGLVIVHAANNAFENWPEFNLMIGMGWRGNGFGERLTLDADGKEVRVPKGQGPGAGHGAKHPFVIALRDTDHPITRGMPKEWLHASDELYHGMRGPLQNVHLLATTFDEKKYGGTGEQEPMIWTVTYGKGRVFHTPMGHDVEAMRCAGFITTLQRGTEWAATGTVTVPIPTNFPTAERTSSVPGR